MATYSTIDLDKFLDRKFDASELFKPNISCIIIHAENQAEYELFIINFEPFNLANPLLIKQLRQDLINFYETIKNNSTLQIIEIDNKNGYFRIIAKNFLCNEKLNGKVVFTLNNEGAE